MAKRVSSNVRGLSKRSRATLTSSAVLGIALFPSTLGAATIVVNTTADTTATDGQCTLREALQNANANADTTGGDCQSGMGLDTVVVSNVTGTIVLGGNRLDITDSVHVEGPAVISANNESRVFAIRNPASQLEVVLDTLTVRDGYYGGGVGGGIFNDGESLTIRNLTITGNTSSVGGGVAATGLSSTLTILDTTISGNTATSGGAGVDARYCASVTIDNSTITNNTPAYAGYGGGGGVVVNGIPNTTHTVLAISNTVISQNISEAGGGGIHVANASGSILSSAINENQSGGGGGALYAGYSALTIDHSVAASNQSDDAGGAVYAWGGEMTVVDSTIDGNEASYGGGIAAVASTLSISGVTISRNAAAEGGGIHIRGSYYLQGAQTGFLNSTISANSATDGGGVFVSSPVNFDFVTIANNTATHSGGGILTRNASAELNHSIAGDNTAPDGDVAGTGAFGARFTLVENRGSASVTDRGGNIFGVTPQLGPLVNNGGPTSTHLPEVDSPVIDAGDPAFAPPPATDQRGGPRPIRRVDIGAVEVNPGAVEFSNPTYSVNENAGTVAVSLERTGGFDGPVQVDVLLSNGTGTVGSDITPAAATATFNALESTTTVTFTVNEDSQPEGDETIQMMLGNARRATIGAQSSAILTIEDNDNATVADVSVTKSAATEDAPAGSDLEYTIVVRNGGPGQAANVDLTDALPAQTTFQSITAPTAWNCAAPPAGATGTITCSSSELAANTSATFLLKVNVDCPTPDGAMLRNTASVTSSTGDPDSANNSSVAATMVSNGSPVITDVSVDKPVLWPPNNRMIDVVVNYGGADNCGPMFTTLSITSNEAVGSEPDWEIVDDHLVRLRAERSGSGDGRIYTITITATDGAGQSVSQQVFVTVPHDRK